jgi:hypothetical protein
MGFHRLLQLQRRGLVVLYLQHIFPYKKPPYDVRSGPFAYAIGETDANFASKSRTISSCSECLFSHRPCPGNSGSSHHAWMMVGSIVPSTLGSCSFRTSMLLVLRVGHCCTARHPGTCPATLACSAWRVESRVFISDSLGRFWMMGLIIHANPKGTSRVNEMARHSAHTPRSRSWNLQ